MQGQTIITTHDVDELFISPVIRLIQRRAFPNLRNIIAKTHSVPRGPRVKKLEQDNGYKIEGRRNLA